MKVNNILRNRYNVILNINLFKWHFHELKHKNGKVYDKKNNLHFCATATKYQTIVSRKQNCL